MLKHRTNIPVLASVIVLILTVFFIATSSSQEDALANVTIGNEPPTMGDVTVDPSTYSPSAGIDYTINCSATASDDNGHGDIVKVNATLFHSSSSEEDSDGNDTHYGNDTCALGVGDNLNKEANCTFYVKFWADDGDWTCNMTAWDGDNANGSENDSLTIDPQRGFDVPSDIGFGTMDLGDITPDIDDTNITVSNLGNDGIDIQVNSTDMDCDGSEDGIPVGNTHYNASSGQAYADMCALTTEWDETCDSLNGTFNLADCSNDCPNGSENKTTYWKIEIPADGVDGVCTATVTFASKDDGEG